MRILTALLLFFAVHGAAYGDNMSKKVSHAESVYLQTLQNGDLKETLKRLDKLLSLHARAHGEWSNQFALAVDKAGSVLPAVHIKEIIQQAHRDLWKQRSFKAYTKFLAAHAAAKANHDKEAEIDALRGVIVTLGQAEKHDIATPYCEELGKYLSTTDKHPLDAQTFMVYFPQPTFPRAAVRQGGGFVELSVTVNAKGYVEDPKVVNMVGHKSLARAALEAAGRMRYAPRYVNGEAQAVKDVTYKFTWGVK